MKRAAYSLFLTAVLLLAVIPHICANSNGQINVSAYGVRAINPNIAPARPGYTGDCTAGSKILPVSNSSGLFNKDGLVVYNCGATNPMARPSAPMVIPSIAAAMTGTLIDVPANPGSIPFSYKIVARDAYGGLTAASNPTSISNGNPLGVQIVNITTATMINQLVTATTSFAHTLTPGSMIIIANTITTGLPAGGNSEINAFNGTFIVSTVPDNTHFTFYTNYDARSGFLTAVIGGQAVYWNCNHLSWAAVPGAVQYYIYGRTSGSWNLIGVSVPFGPTLATDITGGLHWTDFGSPMTTAPNLPFYVPPSAPSSPTNDMLITTIVDGAGTTNLVLADAPSQTISGQTILFDNSLNYLRAANDALSYKSVLNVPCDADSYIFNAPVTIPPKVEMQLCGNLYLNETMTLSMSDELWGEPSSNVGIPSFAFKPGSLITDARANPGFIGVGSNYFHWLSIGPTGGNANLLYFGDVAKGGDIPGSSFEYMNFSTSNGETDYMSMAMMFRSDHTTLAGGEYPVFLHYILFLATQNGANSSYTPVYYGSYSGSNLEADNIFLSGKGMFVRVPDTGGATDVKWIYSQGNYEPFFSYTHPTGSNAGYAFRNISNATFDTTLVPFVANLGSGAPGSQTLTLYLSGVRLSPTQLTGSPATANGRVLDGFYGQTYTFPSSMYQGSFSISPGYSIFTNSVPAPAPTCVVSAGGSVPIAANNSYTVVPVWANGSEGVPSLYCSAPTTIGNQTVTVSWTPILGAVDYNVYRTGNTPGGALVNLGQHIQSPYVDTYGFTNSQTAPTVPAGGPAGITGDKIWATRLKFGQTTVGALPKASANVGMIMYVTDSTPITTEGQACIGGGATGAIAISNGAGWKCF